MSVFTYSYRVAYYNNRDQIELDKNGFKIPLLGH
jgi:hypothetical protein